MTIDSTATAATGAGSEHLLGDEWADALEVGVRGRIRTFIEELVEAELEAALSRKRYERRRPGADDAAGGAAARAIGHRHGHRERTLLGTFGAVTVGVPRARIKLRQPLPIT